MAKTKQKTKTVLLIDGDELVYQVGLAAENPIDWGDGLLSLQVDLDECKEAFVAKVQFYMDTMKADEAIFGLSCSTEDGYRRKQLSPLYKANRAGNRKPVAHRALREWLQEEFDTILCPPLEADDILGILSTKKVPGERRIIVSQDKDFGCVPGLFYRTCRPEAGVCTITKDFALRYHAIQTLAGDATDGYGGVPKVGPVKAARIIADVDTKDLWPTIVEAYAKAGLSEEVALTNARLAYILQADDYNQKTKILKLWTPPKRKKKKS